MTLKRTWFITFIIGLVLLWSSCFLHAESLFIVTSVEDGDSITCNGYGIIFRVKLAGIHAPEIGSMKKPSQPYAEKAKEYLENLILGKKVSIKQIALDRRNRVLGIIYLDRKSGIFSSHRLNVNLQMVKEGYAIAQREKRYYFDIEAFSEAEKEAKAKKLNIWSQTKQVSQEERRQKN
jgi:endonuclease YncB( thermonuclease family)